jgi:hypothetical protein
MLVDDDLAIRSGCSCDCSDGSMSSPVWKLESAAAGPPDAEAADDADARAAGDAAACVGPLALESG